MLFRSLSVLKNPQFVTDCLRDKATTAKKKAEAYDWYGVKHPTNNVGQNMVCELDHLVSLELGGADTLDNIWPQCGPSRVELNRRYFKRKDLVEMWLGAQVKAGAISLDDAQRGIAEDWTQFLDDANAYFSAKKKGSPR